MPVFDEVIISTSLMNEIIDLDETAGDSKFACNLHFAFGIDVLQTVYISEKCMTGKEQMEY